MVTKLRDSHYNLSIIEIIANIYSQEDVYLVYYCSGGCLSGCFDCTKGQGLI